MKLLKFYTPHCVNCPNVTQFLEDNHIDHESVNLFDYPEKSVKYKVLGVPTVMIVDENDKEISRFVSGNIEPLKEYLKQNEFYKGD